MPDRPRDHVTATAEAPLLPRSRPEHLRDVASDGRLLGNDGEGHGKARFTYLMSAARPSPLRENAPARRNNAINRSIPRWRGTGAVRHEFGQLRWPPPLRGGADGTRFGSSGLRPEPQNRLPPVCVVPLAPS